jgi:hypothetical protein
VITVDLCLIACLLACFQLLVPISQLDHCRMSPSRARMQRLSCILQSAHAVLVCLLYLPYSLLSMLACWFGLSITLDRPTNRICYQQAVWRKIARHSLSMMQYTTNKCIAYCINPPRVTIRSRKSLPNRETKINQFYLYYCSVCHNSLSITQIGQSSCCGNITCFSCCKDWIERNKAACPHCFETESNLASCSGVVIVDKSQNVRLDCMISQDQDTLDYWQDTSLRVLALCTILPWLRLFVKKELLSLSLIIVTWVVLHSHRQFCLKDTHEFVWILALLMPIHFRVGLVLYSLYCWWRRDLPSLLITLGLFGLNQITSDDVCRQLAMGTGATLVVAVVLFLCMITKAGMARLFDKNKVKFDI